MKLLQDTYFKRILRKLFKRILRKLNAYLPASFTLRWRHGEIGKYLAKSKKVPGFLTEDESVALAYAVMGLPPNPIIVEIGTFLGQSSIVFAGCLKVKGGGKLHCIDPFDGSGDSFSVPFYQRIASRKKIPLREWFESNIARAGLNEWLSVHQGTAETIGLNWSKPIDAIFFDGDQTPQGVRKAYELFSPYLKKGALIILHNSTEREYDDGHDGHYRLVLESIKAPAYEDVYSVDSTTFARKLS